MTHSRGRRLGAPPKRVAQTAHRLTVDSRRVLYDTRMRCAVFLVLGAMLARSQSLPEGIRFHQGAASNTVLIGETTAVYGAPTSKVTRVLLTHARRDAISAGNGR